MSGGARRRGAAPKVRLGVDENGLGARLGPLVVTAVTARIDGPGRAALERELPETLRADLDDSKRLVAHGDVSLAEAWARAVVPGASTPAELFTRLTLEGERALRAECPGAAEPQCWHLEGEQFCAPSPLLARVVRHVDALRELGVAIVGARSSVVCVRRLNEARERGVNRFAVDLHAMERLVLEAREALGLEVEAVCGKVGGLAAYGPCFGPLAGRLHVVVEEGRASSVYRFPGLGELRFVRDADAVDPLVMVASLIGKWLRELLMARIGRFHQRALGEAAEGGPSGYHDPVTAAFVLRTLPIRQGAAIPDACFERAGRARDVSVAQR